MSAGDLYIFSNNASSAADFVNLSTNNTQYDTRQGAFLFDNTLGLTQNFYVAGHYLGPPGDTPTNPVQAAHASLDTLAQFNTNFALGTLQLSDFTTVEVWDAFMGVPGLGTNDGLKAALYLENLVLAPDSLLIISSNVDVYFITSNAWTAANFDLLGDAELHQLVVIPEPNTLMMWSFGVAATVSVRRYKKSCQKRKRNG